MTGRSSTTTPRVAPTSRSTTHSRGRASPAFGNITLYPQDTNLPGTALGSFALRGSATVLFETSSQTQYDGMKRNGMLTRQVKVGLGGLVDAVADGSIDSLDPNAYEEIPNRVTLPSDTKN